MNYSCLHTHTTFCDGADDIETCCHAAWEKGLAAIGFSSHAPITKKTGFSTEWHIPEDRIEEYAFQVRAAKSRWEGRLRVFLGLEIDYIRGLMGPADKDYQELGLDYTIGSVHYLVPPRGRPFTVDGPREELENGLTQGFQGDPEALVEAYWDAVEEMIRAGSFDILGHVDLIKKNNVQKQWFSPEGASYRRRLSQAADLIGRFKTLTEINTGGLNRGKIPDTYPSLPLLRLLKERKVPVIITADAHRARDLDGHYEEARRVLLEAGYAETVLFEGRKNGKPMLRKVPL
jgi:histidinol-phosphatase (PHP family)